MDRKTNSSKEVKISKTPVRFISEAAIIGAMYAALTILIPGGSQEIQVRVSEALTVLAFLTPAAIPGLFAGCILANFVVGAGPYDIVFGSLATLAAAFLTYKMPRKYLAPLPPVIVNAVVVAFVLHISIQAPLLATMGFVALGELIACYGVGYPLLLLLEKQKSRLFGSR
ncbi:MAG TPA: QueT transporter family protein [Clostridia bacterium]|nr:QueT transporter family protein [Clostridia bacterium]